MLQDKFENPDVIMEEFPHAIASDSLSPFGEVQLSLYRVLANGSCFYNALPATIHKAFSGVTVNRFQSRLGPAHSKTAQLLLECCQTMATKPDKEGNPFRKLFVKLIKSGARNPELGSALAAIDVPELDQQIRSRAQSQSTTNIYSLARHVQVPTYGDETTIEIIKNIFPFLNIFLVASVGSADGQLRSVLGGLDSFEPAISVVITLQIWTSFPRAHTLDSGWV